MTPEKSQSHSEILPAEQDAQANGNGNVASAAKNGELRPMWEGPVHFRLTSAEATLVLPAETPVEIDEIVVSKDSQRSP